MKTMSRVAPIAALVLGTAATVAIAQDDADLTMPKSMTEFINWHLDNNEFGTWEESGVTTDLWVGIPAGLNYTSTSTMTLSQDGQRILYTYHMGTEDGRTISTGTGFSFWDSNTNAPMSSSSGFDMGKPYHGTGKLVGMNAETSTIVWEYTEHSQGKTNVYRDTLVIHDANSRTSTVKNVNGKGDSWVSNETRVNHLKAHGLDAMIGTWEMELPEGDRMRTTFSWASNQMSIVARSALISKDSDRVDSSMSVIFWNPAIDQIQMVHIGGNGAVIPGEVMSITRKGDETTMVVGYEGVDPAGNGLRALETSTITADTMTVVFSNMTINGMVHPFSWENVPLVSKKVERRERRQRGARGG